MSDSPFIVEIENIGHFEQQVLEASKQQPILVDFWADWCQPCKTLMPMLMKLAEEYQGAFILAKVNADQHQELVASTGVRNLPTVKLFKDGAIVDEFMGALPESELRQFLDKHIENETDIVINEALSLADAGQVEQAIDSLKALNQQDPSNSKVYIAIAKVYLMAKDFENCEAVIKALPANVQILNEVKQLQHQLELIQATHDAPEINELIQQVDNEPDNHELRFQLANQYIVTQQYESALEALLVIVSKDINFQEGAAKAAMLKVFDTLGNQDPLTRQYRSKLATLLY